MFGYWKASGIGEVVLKLCTDLRFLRTPETGMPLSLQTLWKITRKYTISTGYGYWSVKHKFGTVNPYLCHQVGCGKLLETLPTRLAFDFEIIRTNDVRGLSVINILVLENSLLMYPHKRVGSTVYTILFENTNVRVSRREVLRSEKPTCVTTWFLC